MARLRWLAVCVALLGTTTSIYAWAEQGSDSGRIEKQTFAWTTNPATTSSTKWRPLADLKVITGCPGAKPITAALSVQISGGRAEFRLLADDPTATCVDCPGPEGVRMRPGRVRVDAMKETAMSFVFVMGNPPGSHGTKVLAYWRSPRGTALTLKKGTLNALWDKFEGLCG